MDARGVDGACSPPGEGIRSTAVPTIRTRFPDEMDFTEVSGGTPPASSRINDVVVTGSERCPIVGDVEAGAREEAEVAVFEYPCP